MIDKRKFYINGTWINPIIKNDFEVINPSNEEPCATISIGGSEDVHDAVPPERRDDEPARDVQPERDRGGARLALVRVVDVEEDRGDRPAEPDQDEAGDEEEAHRGANDAGAGQVGDARLRACARAGRRGAGIGDGLRQLARELAADRLALDLHGSVLLARWHRVAHGDRHLRGLRRRDLVGRHRLDALPRHLAVAHRHRRARGNVVVGRRRLRRSVEACARHRCFWTALAR